MVLLDEGRSGTCLLNARFVRGEKGKIVEDLETSTDAKRDGTAVETQAIVRTASFGNLRFSGCQKHLDWKGGSCVLVRRELDGRALTIKEVWSLLQSADKSLADIRDAVLHERYQLAEAGADSDVINAVLGIIDDHAQSF